MGCSNPFNKNGRCFRNRYELGRKIGFGAFAQVRSCTDKKTGKEYAVKLICRPYPVCDLNLELDLLKKLNETNCPNIVDYYCLFEDEHFYYLVMEYCSGGELFKYILDSDSTVKEYILARWIRQILVGIDHIHQLGIVHRDIKPQNIVFADRTYQVLKLIDFGLSFELDQNRLIDEPCGTAEFVAPEMIIGKYGRRVDVWSLGVIFYLLLFGTLPFSGANNQELFKAIIEQEPEWTYENINPPSGAVDLCKQLLRKNFNERPKASVALNHPWLHIGPEASSESQLLPSNVRRKLRQYSVLGREDPIFQSISGGQGSSRAAGSTVEDLHRFRKKTTDRLSAIQSASDQKALLTRLQTLNVSYKDDLACVRNSFADDN